jgi:hypothetical protein
MGLGNGGATGGSWRANTGGSGGDSGGGTGVAPGGSVGNVPGTGDGRNGFEPDETPKFGTSGTDPPGCDAGGSDARPLRCCPSALLT